MDSIKNNNNNNNNNTMNSKATDNNKNNNNDVSMTACVTNKPSCKRTGESNPLLYKAAARNLREYHGVPSMTAGGLEKTMVLLQLRPGRLVAQGLAPKQLLKGKSAPRPDADNTDSSTSSTSSSSGSEVEPEQADNNLVSDDSNSNSSDGSDTEYDNVATQDSIGIEAGASKHPIHAVFVAAGVQLRPRETRPLLRSLGVGPHRLVKLGLVQREEVRRSRPGGRKSGPPHQHHGHPGGRGHHHHRGGGGMMSRPRGHPPHCPPPHRHGHGHGHGRRPAHGDRRRSSSPTHGPPRGPFEEYGGLHLHHGAGNHHHHHHHRHGGGESEGEADMAMMYARPRGPPHGMHPPPHLRGQPKGGPRPHGMPMHDRQMHSFHGGRRLHGEGVHSSGGKGERDPAMPMGPGHHAHPRRHPEHHGIHHLDSDGDAAGMDMDHGPLLHGAGRHHHRSPVGLRRRLHGPPPGPPGMRGGMRCEDIGDDFHLRQHQRHQQHQQHLQQHGRMAAGRARVHPCHERRAPLQMMPMQAY